MNYVIAILVFGLLIFVHELGHFLVAKACGITVLQFTIGFGPAIFKKKIGHTLYALRLLPIGGAVMMQGEGADEEDLLVGGEKVDLSQLPPGGSYAEAGKLKRFLVMIAGVTMNFLLAVVILFLLILPGKYKVEPVLASFMEGFPYAAADNGGVGFAEGDRLIKINDFHIYTMGDFSMAMAYDADAHYDVTLRRGGETIRLQNYEMHPTVYDAEKDSYLYGFRLASVEMGLAGKVGYAFRNAMSDLQSAVLGLKMLLTGQVPTSDMMGTVGIANEMGELARTSLPSMWYFVAYISVNLAFVNLLPLPVLDGGKILFLLLELIRGKKLDPKYEVAASLVSMVLLLALFLFITYHDVLRIIH